MKPEQFINYRERFNLNRLQMARQLGVSHTTVMRWERGERPIPVYVELALKALADGHTIEAAQ